MSCTVTRVLSFPPVSLERRSQRGRGLPQAHLNGHLQAARHSAPHWRVCGLSASESAPAWGKLDESWLWRYIVTRLSSRRCTPSCSSLGRVRSCPPPWLCPPRPWSGSWSSSSPGRRTRAWPAGREGEKFFRSYLCNGSLLAPLLVIVVGVSAV